LIGVSQIQYSLKFHLRQYLISGFVDFLEAGYVPTSCFVAVASRFHTEIMSSFRPRRRETRIWVF